MNYDANLINEIIGCFFFLIVNLWGMFYIYMQCSGKDFKFGNVILILLINLTIFSPVLLNS